MNVFFQDEPKNPASIQLLSMIERACDPSLFEPNYALNLDICDFVNQKQLGYPREAAFFTLRYINSRNQAEAMHALTLLDLLVKNCGYPFHLVIASKDFLNEIVRRFPEKPSPFPNPVQSRILEFIQQWKLTLCTDSRHKNDLKHIEDMYNLLNYKGYRFPGVSKESIQVLKANPALKTEEELEAEDRAVLSAKLQELLRQGTPGALERANEIMKTLAGYEPEKKPDYKKQVTNELDKIRDKVMQLNDGLIKLGPKESVNGNDKLKEFYDATKAAQPRLQKLISECEDESKMETLLTLNDLINTVIQKYEDARAGKPIDKSSLDNTRLPPTRNTKPEQSKSPSSSNKPAPSLIDFDFDGGPVGSISLGDSMGVGGSSSSSSSKPAQPTSQQQQQQPAAPQLSGSGLLDDLAGLSFTNTSQPTKPLLPNLSTSMPFQQQKQQMPFTTTTMPLQQPFFPQPMQVQPVVQHQQQQTFMMPTTQPIPPSGSQKNLFGSFDNLSFMTSPPVVSPITSPSGDITILNKNGLKINLNLSGSDESKTVTAKFFNTTSNTVMNNLVFQCALPKSMQLKMLPLSSQIVQPGGMVPVTQVMMISNPGREKVRLRFKVTVSLPDRVVEEQGEWKEESSGGEVSVAPSKSVNNDLSLLM